MSLSVVHQTTGSQVTLSEANDRYLAPLSQRFGRRFREYRERWALAEKRAYLGRFPLSLDLALNSGCQSRCPMCPLPARPEAKKRLSWPAALYARVLAEAREHALPALTLGLGGEPLLDPQTPKRVHQAVQAGIMDIRLGTNGRLLTGPVIEALIDSGLTRLEISIDAVEPATYRAIRGGRLESLEKRIELFLEKRAQAHSPWPLLRVSFLRLPQNQGQLARFLQRWRDVADLISIQRPIWFPGSKLPAPKTKTVQTVPCGQPWQRLAIYFDGSVWPCCSWYGEKLLPQNVKTASVSQIWLSKELRGLRQSLLMSRAPVACLDCARAGAF
ncbi:MAG: radical SAM protein [Deltaproteobacteria bacterium]|nr:radical SAM protein [Deltaproteobacteria bacterium]